MESYQELTDQLRTFVETLKCHPFRDGVWRPEPDTFFDRYLYKEYVRDRILNHNPSILQKYESSSKMENYIFLLEYSGHLFDCFHGLCMGYHTALLTVYMRTLSEKCLSEFFRELMDFDTIGDIILNYICVYVFSESPYLKTVEVDEYRDRDCTIYSSYDGSKKFKRGRLLAENTQGTVLAINRFTFGGEGFLIPEIWPKETGEYLTGKQVHNILIKEGVKKMGENGFEYIRELKVQKYHSAWGPAQLYDRDTTYWNFEEKERPNDTVVSETLKQLDEQWSDIAGPELAQHTRPDRFTGRRKRRLVVLANPVDTPSWGQWDKITKHPEQGSFTDFRKSVNGAIAPLEVDHISFDTKVNMTSQISSLMPELTRKEKLMLEKLIAIKESSRKYANEEVEACMEKAKHLGLRTYLLKERVNME